MDLSFFIMPKETILTIYDIPEFTDEFAMLTSLKLITEYRPDTETVQQSQILFEVIRHDDKDIIIPIEIRVDEEVRGLIDMFNMYDISGYDVKQLPIYEILSFHLKDDEAVRNHITIMPSIMPGGNTLVYWDLSEDSTLYESFMKGIIERYFLDESKFLRYCSLRGITISKSTLKNHISNNVFPKPYYSKKQKKNLYNPNWISYIDTINQRKTGLIMHGKKIKHLSSIYSKDFVFSGEETMTFSDIMDSMLRDRFKNMIDNN